MQKQTSEPRQQTGQTNTSNLNPQPQQGEDQDTDMEDDTTPELDENDLEENDITEEEADNVEWEAESGPNAEQQGVDKAPGEERGKTNKLTNKDLKGKQVDADPSTEQGKPLSNTKQ